ncbi:MAG TPA: prepilin-type N-terminal cleavage/methylation domain-containing protein [Actinomycetota bacterium]|nr:prepilin-type N-terminal cleavage/methylation domain-containing protein [Actinomycetota bacterium]
MTTCSRRERGLTLIETLVAITIFSIMTVGIVPMIAASMKGGSTARTGSVARNAASKTLERLRGLQYHVAYSSTPRKVDLLDHFFPGRTPAYVASVGTGYDAATQSYVTTCDAVSTDSACKALPNASEIPQGFLVEVRATFRQPANPTATAAVPATYAWDAASGNDAPPSELLEVKVTTAWSVGSEARTFDLTSYLGARARAPLAGPAATPPPSGGGSSAPPPPTTVKLRAEARIDYGYEFTTTYQDNSNPAKVSEYSATLGTGVAYGEQLDSGSKAELRVTAGDTRIVRPPNPAVAGDAGLELAWSGAVLDAQAPPDSATTTTASAPEFYAMHSETPITGGAGYLAASEVGTLSGPRGAGPTVAGGLPFVKGYYDLNGTTGVSPASGFATHAWLMPQLSGQPSGTETTTNPLNHYTSAFSRKTITISDYGTGGTPSYAVDPRGEVSIDSTPTAPAGSRAVTSSATIPPHGMILIFPSHYTTTNAAVLQINQFDANVSCAARADPGVASTATGSWKAELWYYEDTDTRDNRTSYSIRRTTLPTQTRTDNPTVPYGHTNPLQAIKAQNGGNGPHVYDVSGTAYDVWLFAGNGRRGILTGWSQGAVQTSISGDDRVASAELNGAIRLESSPVWGPWPNTSTGQVSQKPQSDFTFSMGKLSCKAEDYR